MNEKQEVLSGVLKNFAGLTPGDVTNSLHYWRTRKIAKGEFFNMQTFVCTDLALIVKEFSGFITFTQKHRKKRICIFFLNDSSWFLSGVLLRNTNAIILYRRWRMPKLSQ
jgi:hypothetical protein